MKLIGSPKQFSTGGIPSVCVTGVLSHNDSRASFPEFGKAKNLEIKRLMDRKTFEIV